jgi:hypothetical protein
MPNHEMPPEPHGDTPLSADVFDHTMIEAFRSAPLAFAVMVDDDKGAVWIGARGRDPDPDRELDVLLYAARSLVDQFLRALGGEKAGGHYEKGPS